MDNRKDRGSSWNWQSHYCNHQPQSSFYDVTECTMTEVTLNQEDHSYMFDDDDDDESTTPVTACTESGYHHVTTDQTIKKKLEVPPRETRSSVKRRRMLQFEDHQPMETTLFSSESFSSILRSSAREETFDELLPEGSQLIEEDASASSFEGLDEEWYADCLNDPDAPTLPDDLSFGSPHEVNVDISEYLNLPPEPPETSEVKRPVVTRSSPNVIFKGRKSFAKTVPKLASSCVIYPFSFIKPCGVDGGIMTLKDINQRILTPPAKPKENKAETPVIIQTSAFSGKPVVGKTRICTEGGKGSITIMRTRG